MILVVGAGPTGLTLACELARRGVPCRVVEKSPRLFVGSRAKGLQPRTLEIFEDLGVLSAIVAQGMPFPPFRLYSGARIVWEKSLEQMLGVEVAPATDAVPYPRAWLIPQWKTDEILHDRFVELGGRVELETELVDLTRDGVATLRSGGKTETTEFDYVVGCDGGRSFVRKTIGFSFLGETNVREQTLIGDVRVRGIAGIACHILTHEGDVTRRFSLWNLPGTEYFQFVATVADDEVPPLTLGGLQSLLEARSGRSDIHLDDLRWVSLHRIHTRMVDRMQIGRVLLAGDAAHVHSSAGGQGLNTGVQDAYNLGWKLAAATKGNTRVLATYDEERLPIAAHVLGLTDQLHRQDFRAGRVPPIHQLDIGYRGSSLCLPSSEEGALQPGDRAPDARLGDGRRLFDVMRGTHWTLVAVGASTETAPHGVVTCSIAAPSESYSAGTLVLIRPDGYVAAIVRSRAALEPYLQVGMLEGAR